jgi:DinB family protein
MDLYPEQIRALDYLKRKGTDTPADEIRRKVAGMVVKLEEAVDAVPVSLREVSPGPGRWSVQEIVDHLVESHRPALAQLEALLKGRTPETPAVPASLQSADPFSWSWSLLVDELSRVHDSLWDLIRDATDEHPLHVRAPIVMVVKVARPDGSLEPVQWEERLDWKAFVQALRVHSLEHVAQIERTVAEVSAVKTGRISPSR